MVPGVGTMVVYTDREAEILSPSASSGKNTISESEIQVLSSPHFAVEHDVWLCVNQRFSVFTCKMGLLDL